MLPSLFGTGETEQLLAFTEPIVAFSLEQRAAGSLRIRVHFSLGALPPWLRGEQEPDLFGCFIVLDVTAAELARAAWDWRAELARFPLR